MTRPEKALLYSQLKQTGDALPPSGHKVEKVSFDKNKRVPTGDDAGCSSSASSSASSIEPEQGGSSSAASTGSEQIGFFKPIEASYPPMAASCASGISIAMEQFMGERVGVDVPVLRDGRVVGTVSIAIPGFKSMLAWGDALPKDEEEQRLLNPDVTTMMNHGMTRVLIAEHVTSNDDPHPGNIGIGRFQHTDANGDPVEEIYYCSIDNDMRFFDLLGENLKGLRKVDGVIKDVPSKGLPIRGRDLDDLPNIPGKTFFPPYVIPGNLNVRKTFKACAAFASLSGNPSVKRTIETATGPVVVQETFQQQYFSELLHYLITFDPDTLRSRLYEYFGDMPLDYLSLPEYNSSQLSRQDPELYNTETNKQPFVDYMVKLAQKKYDEVYRAVVFYDGCSRNMAGVSVMSFKQFLQNHPSAWRKTMDWTEKENQRQKEHWSRQESFFNSVRLEQRYHKIWRDSRVLMMQESIHRARLLSQQLTSQLQKQPPDSLSVPSKMSADNPDFFEAWFLIDGLVQTDNPPPFTDCSPNNFLKTGLENLDAMINKLYACTRQYYELPRNRLNDEANQQHKNDLQHILQEHCTEIYSCLTHTLWEKPFNEIVNILQEYQSNLDFYNHRIGNDSLAEAMQDQFHRAYLQRDHTEPDIIDASLEALFNWAGQIDEEIFNNHILDIILTHYKQASYNLMANRQRGEDVQAYLKANKDNGANKLAWILAVGGQESTSLNTQLIKHLMPHVLKSTMTTVGCNLRSLACAYQNESFNVALYTEKAAVYARTHERFNHIYTDRAISQFNGAMYRWVDNLSRPIFLQIVEKAIAAYKPSGTISTFFSKKSRHLHIAPLLRNPTLSNQRLLASIFSEGAINETSLNTILFKKLVTAMQSSILASQAGRPDALVDPGDALIMQISTAPDNPKLFNYFLTTLQEQAKPRISPVQAQEEASCSFAV